MADYQLTHPGPTVQQALDIALGVEQQISQEAAAREAADALLATKTELAAETSRAQAAEALLATIAMLDAEIARATGVEGTLQSLIAAINEKIPSAASSANQLADKAFVNSSIGTSSATYISNNGEPFTSVAQLNAYTGPHDKNDYAFVVSTDAAGNTVYSRYKYDGSEWAKEYDLNNSSFTAAQWAAINSAVTAELVNKLSALPDNATLTAALAAKQDVIDDLSSIRSNANSAYQKPSSGIPASDIADGVIPDVSGKVNTSDIADNLTTNDATKVLSAKQGKVLNENLTQLGQDIIENGVQKREYSFSHFNARETAAASVTLGTDILLTDPGDYIEIKTKARTNGYILRRPTSNNQPCIRYYAQNIMQVRFNSSTNWTTQNNALDWNEVQILKVCLDSISGTTYNFKMYVNDTLLGTQDVTDPKGLSQIVYGGTTIDMDIYYIETKIGGVVNRLDKFAEMDGADYVTDVYTTVDIPSLSELDERVADLEADMSIVKKAAIGEDMYYRFTKASTLYNIQSDFRVYQRIKGNYYLQTVLGYYVYNGSAGYPNGYWRIERTNICTLIDGEQTIIQSQVLTSGENEFVLQWLTGTDYNFSGGFSGGYHYGETIDNVVGAWVEFVADGKRLSTDVDIPLTPCKSF